MSIPPQTGNENGGKGLLTIPSPVYQKRYALRRNIAANWSCVLVKRVWTAVVFPTKVPEMAGPPAGGTLQSEEVMACGIHSTKKDEFFCSLGQ